MVTDTKKLIRLREYITCDEDLCSKIESMRTECKMLEAAGFDTVLEQQEIDYYITLL